MGWDGMRMEDVVNQIICDLALCVDRGSSGWIEREGMVRRERERVLCVDDNVDFVVTSRFSMD